MSGKSVGHFISGPKGKCKVVKNKRNHRWIVFKVNPGKLWSIMGSFEKEKEADDRAEGIVGKK